MVHLVQVFHWHGSLSSHWPGPPLALQAPGDPVSLRSPVGPGGSSDASDPPSPRVPGGSIIPISPLTPFDQGGPEVPLGSSSLNNPSFPAFSGGS